MKRKRLYHEGRKGYAKDTKAAERLRRHRVVGVSFVSFVVKRLFILSDGRQPGGKAATGLGDVLGRAGKGKTDPAVAVDRVEIASRGHRDPGLAEELPAEGAAVAGQRRDVGIEIEGAVGRGEAG